MTILLVGDLTAAEYAEWRTALERHFTNHELVGPERAFEPGEVEIALVANPPHGALAELPRLRFIQSLWAGVDRLLTDSSIPAHIPIARLIDPTMTQAMVECALGHVLCLHRQLPTYHRQQAERLWRPWAQPLARERHIGVLGLGTLGLAVARALQGLGFPVSGWSTHVQERAGIAGYSGAPGLVNVARASEILINLLPLTRSTAGILNAALFAEMPRGAALINLARGQHLHQQDLLAALAAERLSHAVLDVFDTEPLPHDHPFWANPKITVMPHVAAPTDPASAVRMVAANIAAFLHGRPVSGLVDRARGY